MDFFLKNQICHEGIVAFWSIGDITAINNLECCHLENAWTNADGDSDYDYNDDHQNHFIDIDDHEEDDDIGESMNNSKDFRKTLRQFKMAK